MPPKWMWLFDDLLDEWFKKVEKDRKDGVKPPDDDGDDLDEATVDEWMNQAASR